MRAVLAADAFQSFSNTMARVAGSMRSVADASAGQQPRVGSLSIGSGTGAQPAGSTIQPVSSGGMMASASVHAVPAGFPDAQFVARQAALLEMAHKRMSALDAPPPAIRELAQQRAVELGAEISFTRIIMQDALEWQAHLRTGRGCLAARLNIADVKEGEHVEDSIHRAWLAVLRELGLVD